MPRGDRWKAFDAMCLTPGEPLSPEQIRAIRMRENASQAVCARRLNLTTGLVSQWERGEKRPRGASLKLLTLVAKKGASGGRLKPRGLWGTACPAAISLRRPSPKPTENCGRSRAARR